MSDSYSLHPINRDSPGDEHFAITPDDNADLAVRPRCLFIGVAGNVAIRIKGVDIIYQNVSGLLQLRADRVLATGTNASNIIGWV